MGVINFNFKFILKGKNMTASCHKFKVYTKPQIRVDVSGEKKRQHIFNFWESMKRNKNIFGFHYKE